MSEEKPAHLTELQLAAALVPDAAQPSCPVPGCTACAAKLAEARGTARQFHEEVLPRTLPRITGSPEPTSAPAPRKRTAPRGFFLNLLRPAPIGGLLAVTAAVVVWVKWPKPAQLIEDDPAGSGETPTPYVGVKGDDAVRAYVRRDAQVLPLDDGGAVHPGDAIRFSVDPSAARYALVVSIDGAQQISVYVPFGGQASEAVVPPKVEEAGGSPYGHAWLPGSVELDDTLGDERLWIVLSDVPVDFTAVQPALRQIAAGGAAAVAAAATARLTDFPGTRVRSMLLHKTAR